MQTLKFDKMFLLQRIKENRKRHEEIFNEAIGNYRQTLIEAIEARLELVRTDEASEWHGRIDLEKPQHHIAEYDRVIMMIEHCVETEIELDEHEYAQYVMDNWTWQRGFLTSNSMYSTMAASGCAAL